MDLQGFGVGFRPVHYRHVTETWPTNIDWFEVISENFMGVGGRPQRFLEAVRSRYPVVMHGVALSIGSTDPLNFTYLHKLKELISWLDPGLVSDHLCWTGRGGHNSHDLLPLPLTMASLQHVAARVEQVQEFLGRRLLLENPSAYVGFASDAIPEAHFFAELCQKTGCGVLLDLNNLFVNHRNLGLDPLAYLETLKPSMVGQFHLAGHMTERDAEGEALVRIDTHDAPVCDEVWDLYSLAVQRFPDVPTLIEWDDKIPDFEALASECDRARAIAQQNPPRVSLRSDIASPLTWMSRVAGEANASQTPVIDAELSKLQGDFLSAITQPRDEDANGLDLPILQENLPVSRRVGARVYTDAYYLRLRDCLKDTFSTLAAVCEEDGFGSVVGAYLLQYPPSHYSVKYIGQHFEAFIRRPEFAAAFDFGVESAVLADIAALEWADAMIFDAPKANSVVAAEMLQQIAPESWGDVRFDFVEAWQLVRTCCDAASVVDAVANGEIPGKPDLVPSHYLMFRQDERVERELIDQVEFEILSSLRSGQTFEEACKSDQPEVIEMAVRVLLKAIERQLIARIR